MKRLLGFNVSAGKTEYSTGCVSQYLQSFKKKLDSDSDIAILLPIVFGAR